MPTAWWNPAQDRVGLRELFIPSRENYGSWINVLIILTPLGWISHFLHWSAYAIFIINLVALVPLAMIIGKLTEDLALRFGDTIGACISVCLLYRYMPDCGLLGCSHLHVICCLDSLSCSMTTG